MKGKEPLPHMSADPGNARVVELFAGVGGFRLGLERAGWQVVWSNQWEPSTRRQHASDVYVARFGATSHSNNDIAQALDQYSADWSRFPGHELLVGGFPCQDYSVARTLNQAEGLHGKKGVLWWQIHRLLSNKRPPMLFLENVDRLLKSPAHQRGRDFAVMLASLADLGYQVEWRVVNAADYGFPQRRRRVYIVGLHMGSKVVPQSDPLHWLLSDGVTANALPVYPPQRELIPFPVRIAGELSDVSETFGLGLQTSPFRSAGVLLGRDAWTIDIEPQYGGPLKTLGDVLQKTEEVPKHFFIPRDQIQQWDYLKGSKRESRTHKASGVRYFYTEGAVPFPDPIGRPSRTVLTGEGGTSPSRFKHVVRVEQRRLRRLTPIELERLNGFPDGWTDVAGIGDGRRAFLMGNALIVGIIERVGKVLAERLQVQPDDINHESRETG